MQERRGLLSFLFQPIMDLLVYGIRPQSVHGFTSRVPVKRFRNDLDVRKELTLFELASKDGFGI